jgi:hypothetical protein
VGSEIVLSPEAETFAGWIADLPSVHVRKERLLALVRFEVEWAVDRDREETQGRLCPEDVGLDDYVHHLEKATREKDARIAELEQVQLDDRNAMLLCVKERDALKAEVSELKERLREWHEIRKERDAYGLENGSLKAEVARLQACGEVAESRNPVRLAAGFAAENAELRLDLADARKQIEEAVVVIAHGRRMLRRLGDGETVWHEDEQVLLHGASAEEDDMPQAELDAARALLTAPEGGHRG